MLRWITFFVVLGLLEWYAFQAVKTATQNRWLWLLYGLVVLTVFGSLFWGMYNRTEGMTVSLNYIIGCFLMIVVFQLLLIVFLFD
jgi:CDP-diglyceride synthetase